MVELDLKLYIDWIRFWKMSLLGEIFLVLLLFQDCDILTVICGCVLIGFGYGLVYLAIYSLQWRLFWWAPIPWFLLVTPERFFTLKIARVIYYDFIVHAEIFVVNLILFPAIFTQ